MVKVIEITSLGQYIENIIGENENVKVDAEHNEVLFFRGHSDCNFQILPSIARFKDDHSNVTLIDSERYLIEEAKQKLPSLFCGAKTPVNLLALLQHYGIPTRMLDITKNPLVALFFACLDSEKDGEVIVFKDGQNDPTQYPIQNAVADTYRFAFASHVNLTSFYQKIIEQPYFIEQRQNLYNYNNESGGRWIADCCSKPLFVHAQELSPRQKAQQGHFILFHNQIETDCHEPFFCNTIESIDKNDECIIARLTVPRNFKANLLKNLAIVGITESMLFSDNVDYVCKEITNSQKIRLSNPMYCES